MRLPADKNVFVRKRYIIKGSLGGEIAVLRILRMSGKGLVKEKVRKETVKQGKS